MAWLILALALSWLLWPWLGGPLNRRFGRAPSGRELIVVLDGEASRFSRGDEFRRQILQHHRLLLKEPGNRRAEEPEWLLILCPSRLPAVRPVPLLVQGFDTATQLTALARWLVSRGAPLPRRLWIATDPSHTARATLLARLALAGNGVLVAPTQPPTPSARELGKLWRDALRLTLWRATGSTGAWLAPDAFARKRMECLELDS